MPPFLLQLLRIIAGYLAGTLVFGLSASVPNSVAGSDFLPTMLLMVLIFGVFAAVFALPVTLPLILFSEWFGKRTAILFGAAGLIAGGIYVGLFFITPKYADIARDWPAMLGMTIGAGLSGLVYWYIAGRHAGLWRKVHPDQGIDPE